MESFTYLYYRKCGTRTAYLVLHGGGTEGIESPFITNIITSLTHGGSSVLGFNFPYCERGEENSSGPELSEEVGAITTAVNFLKSEGYDKIVIVAKSFGGIAASFWLEKHHESNAKLVVLGYVIGNVKTNALRNKLQLVIQGENDRFGNAQAVKDELATYNVGADVVEIPNADHSYRNTQKKPAYQNQAIAALLQAV